MPQPSNSDILSVLLDLGKSVGILHGKVDGLRIDADRLMMRTTQLEQHIHELQGAPGAAAQAHLVRAAEITKGMIIALAAAAFTYFVGHPPHWHP